MVTLRQPPIVERVIRSLRRCRRAKKFSVILTPLLLANLVVSSVFINTPGFSLASDDPVRVANPCEQPNAIVHDIDPVLLVVGEQCHSSNQTQDSTIVTLPATGDYQIYGRSLRGNPDQQQTNESFYLEVDGVRGVTSADDPDPAAITTRTEYLGTWPMPMGPVAVLMKTAAQCPPDTHANSVRLNRLCLLPKALRNGCTMELVKTDDPDPVAPGALLRYRLKLTNTGSGVCTGGGVELRETYDIQTTFVSATPTPTTGDRLWNFGDVPPGTGHEVDVAVRVAADAAGGTVLVNRACFWTREYGDETCVEERTTVRQPAACGNKNIDAGEQCDDGNLKNFDGCNARCQREVFACPTPLVLHFEADAAGAPIQAGQKLDDEFASQGITISARNANPAHPQIAIAFDGNRPSGGPDSLDHGTPNAAFGGPGIGAGGATNNTALGLHLIIPRRDTDANGDGLVDNPAEDGAGTTTFTFASPMLVQQVTAIDIDHNPGQHAAIGRYGTSTAYTVPIPLAGDNSVQYINLPTSTPVTSLELAFHDSFGVDNLVLCPVAPRTVCGDGRTQSPNDDRIAEQCDDGPDNGSTCVAAYGASCQYCSSACQRIQLAGPACGDGHQDTNEACDDGNTVDTDSCTNACAIPTPPPDTGPVCGNSVREGSEQCDDGNTNNNDACLNNCTNPPSGPTGGSSGSGGGGGGGGGGGVVPQAPRLLLSKTVDVPAACPGSQLTYTLKVTNIGNQAGHNLKVTDALPGGFTLATTTATTFETALGDIASYETKTVTYVARVANNATPARYRNSATATIDYPYAPNNAASALAEVRVAEACDAPVLSISKRTVQAFINPGDAVDFVITVANSGGQTAQAVNVSDVLPPGFSATGTLQWVIGDLDPQQTQTITLHASAASTVAPNAYVNTVTASASNHPAVTATSAIEVRRGEVLGAKFSRLPNTGPGAVAAAYFTANLLALAAGLILYRKTRAYGFYH